MKYNLEKDLKRWLKRKASISLASIVVFAISGSVAFAANSTLEGENTFTGNNTFKGEKQNSTFTVEVKGKATEGAGLENEDSMVKYTLTNVGSYTRADGKKKIHNEIKKRGKLYSDNPEDQIVFHTLDDTGSHLVARGAKKEGNDKVTIHTKIFDDQNKEIASQTFHYDGIYVKAMQDKKIHNSINGGIEFELSKNGSYTTAKKENNIVNKVEDSVVTRLNKDGSSITAEKGKYIASELKEGGIHKLSDTGVFTKAYKGNKIINEVEGGAKLVMDETTSKFTKDLYVGNLVWRDTSTKNNELIIGNEENTAVGKLSVAIGFDNDVEGENSTVVGSSNIVKGKQSSAFGNNNSIEKGTENNFILGSNIKIKGNIKNSIVLGKDSTIEESNVVSIGASGKERKIVHVAAGVADTDAVNVGQLKKYNADLEKKGLNFAGNHGTSNKQLGDTMSIKGKDGISEEDIKTKYDVENVVTTVDKDGNLWIKLAKNPKFNSVEAGEGDTKVTIGNDGVKIGDKVYITKEGINGNDQKIVNIADGIIVKNSKDAVNGGQIHDIIQDINNSIHQTNHRIDKLDDKVNKGLANAAAMAGIEFMDIGINQGTVAAAVGGYKGTNAVAVGVQGAPTENTRVNAKVSVAPGTPTEMMYSVGAAYRFHWK
ncbi:hypothetical protein IX329_001540 [Fusobacterium necrophorum]|nr:YadA-like family protein [Fusobacterium necrophorum]MBR8733951.1 hypothetical protein [Fusobacterium necrophorum]MBR8790127.1 hypothetical protein [Fusobacterium necrophorum]